MAAIPIFASTYQNFNTQNSTFDDGNAAELRGVGDSKQALNALPKGFPLTVRFLTATVAANSG
jgi:hypothetical protein